MRRWTQTPAAMSPRKPNNARPSFLFWLLPSFVANYWRPGTAVTLPRRHETSYLDGLRGVAAFIVYTYHYTLMWRWIDLEIGYGSPFGNHYWYQLPIVRVLIGGQASVTVFFVISGYVLSIRTLRLIHGGTQQQQQQQQTSHRILSALSSSVLRRPLRLYLPIVVTTATLAVLVQMRFPFYADHISNAGVAITMSTKQDQLFNWWSAMARLVNPFTIEGMRNQGRHRVAYYNSPLWTIPIEFKGSLAVFLMLLAFARARRSLAMAATLVMGVIWQLAIGDADMALFMAGLFLAELCIVVPPSSISAFVRARSRSWQHAHIVHHSITILLFFSALWFLSTPMIAPAQTPGFKLLARLTPGAYWIQSQAMPTTNMVHLFWLAVGSMLLVLSLMYSPPEMMVDALRSCRYSDNKTVVSVSGPTDEESQQPEKQQRSSVSFAPSTQHGQLPVGEEAGVKDHKEHSHDHESLEPRQQPLLQRLFTNRVAQYLGTLSYSLYLLHEPINHTIGSRYARPGYELWEVYEAFFQPPGMGSMSPAHAQQAQETLATFRWQWWSWFVLGYCLNTVVLIWASDLFMRAVDGPSVRFARWVSRLVE